MRNHAVAFLFSIPIAATVASCIGYTDESPDSSGTEESTFVADDGHTGEAADEVAWLKIIKCPKQDRGVECMIKCNQNNIICRAGEKHPNAPGLGYGQLYECRQALAMTSCWNVYSNGEICVFALGSSYCKMEGGGV